MTEFFINIGLSFIPLFVAMDVPGNIPFILALTKDEEERERARTLRLALITAFALGLGFLALGSFIFSVLGIEPADFLVGGGIILLVLSIKHIITGSVVDVGPGDVMGVVPIGTPLVAGPATLTTILVLIELYGVFVVIIAYLLNLLIAWAGFSQANRIARLLGTPGLHALGKIISLLLAAIAINMIRRGVTEIWFE